MFFSSFFPPWLASPSVTRPAVANIAAAISADVAALSTTPNATARSLRGAFRLGADSAAAIAVFRAVPRPAALVVDAGLVAGAIGFGAASSGKCLPHHDQR